MADLIYPMTDEDGFVFAATGAQYRGLAQRAARSLRAVMGDVQIDLFADASLEDAVFNQVHLVEHKGTRPKIEALRRSRFARTVYLDCDVVAVADASDMFALLHRADMIGVQEMYGNAPVGLHRVSQDIPLSFRQINSGVLGVRANAQTHDFLTEWERRMGALQQRWDQPVLREMLWEAELKFQTLPAEYNLMHSRYITAMGQRMAAPRLLHLTPLHEVADGMRDLDQPFDLSEVLSEPVLKALQTLIRNDRSLGANRSARDVLGDALRRFPKVEKKARKLWRKLR
ncbi:MAG: putative nucleotide-diphospho-sugar transferase [Sulfitobacter sp.]